MIKGIKVDNISSISAYREKLTDWKYEEFEKFSIWTFKKERTTRWIRGSGIYTDVMRDDADLIASDYIRIDVGGSPRLIRKAHAEVYIKSGGCKEFIFKSDKELEDFLAELKMMNHNLFFCETD